MPRFGGDVRDKVTIHEREHAVTVGGGEDGIAITAAYREGIGCVVMAPDQALDDIDSLPVLDLPYPGFDPATTSWPDGDLVGEVPWPETVDRARLDAAADRIMNPEAPNHVTLSLLVVHRGRIVHERYAEAAPAQKPPLPTTTVGRWDGVTPIRSWPAAWKKCRK